MKDFSSSVRMHKLILMSSFIGHLRRPVKNWQHKKHWVVDSDSKLGEQSGLIMSQKLWLILIFS